MSSQTDLDQGGTNRAYNRIYLGPSVGWITTPAPASSLLSITTPGTYNLDPSTTLVTVNAAGAVFVVLPSAAVSAAGPQAQPGLFAQTPVTIVDVGGQAQAHPITILPFTGAQTIMGLTLVQITINFGGFTFKPIDAISGWEQLPP